MLRDLVKPGDENLREMNKKLQNMLEEQLTKNMHLQKVRCEERWTIWGEYSAAIREDNVIHNTVCLT